MSKDAKRLLVVNALYALIPVLLLVGRSLMGKVQLEAYGAGYSAYVVLMEFGIIVLPTLIYFLTPWGRDVARCFWAGRPSWAILLVIPLAICAYFMINGVTVVWVVLLRQFGAGTIPQAITPPASGAQLGLALILIGLVPAVCEECFFRGTLQPMLTRHMKPWAAIVLCGCMFALIHGQAAAVPGHILLGVGLCLVAYWTRSIWYTMLWHLVQNGIAMVIAYSSTRMLEAAQSLQQMQGEGVAMDATQMLVEQPILLLISGVLMAGFFGLGVALFLVLLYFATKKHRQSPIERAPERPSLLAWTPLVIALGCIVYMYGVSAGALLGGGA